MTPSPGLRRPPGRTDAGGPARNPRTAPPTAPTARWPVWLADGLRLDADLHVAVRGRPGLAAAMARAAACGLTDLGIVAHVRPEPDWLDAYVEAVRAAAALSPTRIHCGLELTVLADGSTDLPPDLAPRLSHVDFVRLAPERSVHLTRSVLRIAAALPVPVVLAPPVPADADATAIGAACARAGIAVELTERRRSPSIAVARALQDAGATLVAGSGARSAAAVGRWDHVLAVPDALRPQ